MLVSSERKETGTFLLKTREASGLRHRHSPANISCPPLWPPSCRGRNARNHGYFFVTTFMLTLFS
jgi:hypothetical protein